MKLSIYSLLFLFTFLNSCSQSIEQKELNGSVASAHPLGTQAGLDVLENGGNAFDAAIAVASTLNVVEPMMSGIGGYGTILIYDAKNKSIRYLNPSGKFPVNTNTDLMRKPTPNYLENRTGPKAISTPGNLNAWAEMHKNYGDMPWANLFDSAIKNAENGFKISTNTAKWIEVSFSDYDDYPKSFYDSHGQTLKKDDVLMP